MIRRRDMAAILLLTFFLAAPVLAHKVNIFAYAEGGVVYTESYFPDGRPVEAGVIRVYDASGKQLRDGRSDKEGRFSFPVETKQTLTIEIDASMGHKNSFVLKKEEMER